MSNDQVTTTSSQPLVSIMVPCYNCANTLPLAIASLVAQTYENWICIFVDDGSKDQTKEVIQTVYDNRIHYVRFDQNRGRPIARQKALDLAKGTYLCMLDADDWWYPQKLNIQIHAMIENPNVAVLSAGLALVNNQNTLVGTRIRGMQTGKPTISSPMAKPSTLPIEHAQSIIRMSVAKQFSYDPDFRFVEDSDYLLQILMKYPYGVLPEILYAYSEVESVTPDKILQSLSYSRRMLDKYRHEYPKDVLYEKSKLYLKESIYRLGFAAGLDEWLVQRRAKNATQAQTHEFYQARKTVYQTGAKIFAGTPYEKHFVQQK